MMRVRLALLSLAVASALRLHRGHDDDPQPAVASALRLHRGHDDNPQPDNTWPQKDPPQGRKFLFIHLEKSAGSFLGLLFKRAVLGGNEFNFHDVTVPPRDVPDEYFVVSSIRKPCDQVMSQWSYCCEKQWALKELGHFDTAAGCGLNAYEHGLCPVFRGNLSRETQRGYTLEVEDKNMDAFSEFVADGVPLLTYEQQVNLTFSKLKGGPARVDCWVHFDNIAEDAEKCLREYSRVTGNEVDLEAARGKFWFNKGKHAECRDYYTPELEARTRSSNKFLMDFFNLDECC